MRYLTKNIQNDLRKKMVFLGGPRQVGKTTLAKDLFRTSQGRYFNWDLDEDRNDLLSKKWHDENKLLIFDEVHKYPKWKNWVKGIYDTQKEKHQILVTGSARLDVYKKGGDSLLGRYHYWRLHPFTLSEYPDKIAKTEAFKRLMLNGGFPEPFLDNDEVEARRWRKERFDRVLKDDIRDLESIKNIQTLGLFVDALRRRVGSECVLSNIAEDLQVSPVTLKKWLEVLEKMYVIFVLRPWTKNVPRSLQKPPKVYFFDNGDVIGDDGARFENLVATHLLKKLQFLEDRDGFRYQLSYVRDKEGREVDFAIIKDGKLIELVEAKYSDNTMSKSLLYYSDRLKPQVSRQIVAQIKNPYSKGHLHIESPFMSLSEKLT